MPDLILVGYGEALARVYPAILFQQDARRADGLARGGAALQQQHAEALAVDKAAVGLQLCASAEGRFADSELLFVHARVGGVQKMISVCYLVNFAHGNILVAGHLARFLLGPLPFDQCLLFACTVVTGGLHQDVGARAVTVVGVRGHHGTVR